MQFMKYVSNRWFFKVIVNFILTSFQSCYCCKLNMKEGDPAVYAERAGYDKLWHPACFVCCICNELLVDMIYFWKNGNLYCGRHYCDSEKPRCAGCDEVGNLLVLYFILACKFALLRSKYDFQ